MREEFSNLRFVRLASPETDSLANNEETPEKFGKAKGTTVTESYFLNLDANRSMYIFSQNEV